MKTINFINALSERHHKELNRWYQLSACLFIALITGIIIVTFKQYSVLSALKHEQEKMHTTHNTFNAALEEKITLKKQENELNKKIETITQFSAHSDSLTSLLTSLSKVTNQAELIESITLEKNDLMLVVLVAQTQDALTIMKSLQQMPELGDVALLSLQPKQYAGQPVMRVTMKATLKN